VIGRWNKTGGECILVLGEDVMMKNRKADLAVFSGNDVLTSITSKN
jgi:hypothetical protein